MALTVFDAVGKFSADTSQLDQFIVKLERGLPDASNRAAAATLALKQAQDEFRASIKAVSAEGGNTAENLSRLADAEKNLALTAAATKQEHAALRAELTATKESAGVMSQVTEELTGNLAKMLGVIASVEMFKSLIEGTQKSILNLELLSEKTGIAIETLAGLEHVSQAAGVNFDDVSTALVRLSRAQALAAEGGKAQVTAFERIGISLAQLKSSTPEELFYRVADAMANAKNHADANASAFALLGRGGAALIPIFQQNSEELRKMVDEAGRASGVNKDAADAARDWETQTANLTEALRSGLIPVMEFLVPVMKGFEDAGVHTATILRLVAAAVEGLFVTEMDAVKGLGQVYDDVVTGQFKKAAADATAISKNAGNDLSKMSFDFKDIWQRNTDAISDIWKTVNPTKPIVDDLSGLGAVGEKAGKKLAQALLDAQQTMGAALLQLARAQELERIAILQEGISLGQATSNADYAQRLSALAGFDLQRRAIEARAAEDEYQSQIAADKLKLEELQKHGSATLAEQVTLEAKIQAAEDKHEQKLIETGTKAMDALRKVMSQPIPLITEMPPGMDQIDDEITKGFRDADAAAAALGITLKSQLDTSLQATFSNYSKLDDLFKKGIVTQKDLDKAQKEVIKSELQYAQATGATEKTMDKLKSQLRDIINQELAWARATHASTEAIKTLEKELATLDNKGKKSLKDFTSELQHDMQNGADSLTLLKDTGKAAMGELTIAVGDAFAAMITGQDSFGEAMLHGTEKMIGGLAQKWAMYFAAKGIADIMTPGMQAEGAAELAAAVALEAVAGVMNALGSASSSKSTSTSSTTGTPGPAAGSPAATAGAAPTQGRNTTHLAAGGVAMEPTSAVIGDSADGSAIGSKEAILPLEDPKAMRMIAAALMPAIAQFFPKGHDVAFPPIFNTSTIAPAGAAIKAPLLTRETISLASSTSSSSAAVNHDDHASGADIWRKLIEEISRSSKPHGTATNAEPQHIHIKLESDIPHTAKLIAPELSKQVNRGEVKLLSSDSIRHTPRS
jgi:polyhydroxyalkanoate synthesis regulator phasin/type IV secretory pathway VirB2 component (pilin)